MREHDEDLQSDIEPDKDSTGPRKIRTGSDSDPAKAQLTKKCSLSRFTHFLK
jgi:hypothetical protein